MSKQIIFGDKLHKRLNDLQTICNHHEKFNKEWLEAKTKGLALIEEATENINTLNDLRAVVYNLTDSPQDIKTTLGPRHMKEGTVGSHESHYRRMAESSRPWNIKTITKKCPELFNELVQSIDTPGKARRLNDIVNNNPSHHQWKRPGNIFHRLNAILAANLKAAEEPDEIWQVVSDAPEISPIRNQAFDKLRKKYNDLDNLTNVLNKCIRHSESWFKTLNKMERIARTSARSVTTTVEARALYHNFLILSSVVHLELLDIWETLFIEDLDGYNTITELLEAYKNGPEGRTDDALFKKCFKLATSLEDYLDILGAVTEGANRNKAIRFQAMAEVHKSERVPSLTSQ